MLQIVSKRPVRKGYLRPPMDVFCFIFLFAVLHFFSERRRNFSTEAFVYYDSLKTVYIEHSN